MLPSSFGDMQALAEPPAAMLVCHPQRRRRLRLLCAATTICVIVLCPSRTLAVDRSVLIADHGLIADQPVAYSEPRLNTSYRSSVIFDPRGMEHLYYVTNLFLDMIQRDWIEGGALDGDELAAAQKAGNLTETLVRLGLHDWPRLLRHHLGLAIVGGLGLLAALLTPFVGLAVCCGRCAGRCGAAEGPCEKRRDRCRRACYGLILSLLVLLVLFGLVASFVVNEYVERGVKEAPRRLHIAVGDSQLFVKNTRKEVNHLLVDNYRELQSVLDNSLDRCGDRVKAKLANISRAVAVDDLTAIAEGLGDIRRDLNVIAREAQQLRVRADQLTVGLRAVQDELAQLLQLCSSQACQQLLREYDLHQLAVQTEFRQLPDVTRTAREISALIENGIEHEVRAGKAAFDQLSSRIQAEVADLVPEVRTRLRQAGARLESTAADISAALDSIRPEAAGPYIDTAGDYLQQYGMLRYYLFLAISGLTLIIIFCLVVGLFCGFCGRRPGNAYGDDTCNKGSGANFLLSATFFCFLFGWLLLLLVTGMFVVGSLAQLYLCDGMSSPTTPGSGPALLAAALPPTQLVTPPTAHRLDLADVIGKCHRNLSIYTVLNLAPLYDVTQLRKYRDELGIDAQLDTLRSQIQVDTSVELLTPRGKEQLYELAQSDVAHINYTAFTLTLEDRITSVDLDGLGAALETAADLLPPAERSAANRLRNQATILAAHQLVVRQMAAIVVTLRNATVSLQEHVKFNRTNVTEAVRELIEQAEDAQRYLDTRGGSEVIQLADEYAAEFLSRLDGFVSRVELGFGRRLGRCGPLSKAYNSTTVTLCSNIVYPFNGYWAAVGWCLVLFVPCVVVSLCLASLYRKSEPYSEMYDNVREQRAGNRVAGGGERRRTYSPAGGGRDAGGRYHGYSPDSPPYTAIPPRGQQFRPLETAAGGRDADTEPKAPPLWDMPGGPPGYSDSPSGGFERPPPYFYPGPGPERA